MNPERCQTCTVIISWSMLSIEKNSSANNEDTSTISQNLSGSLSKPRNFIGDGSICERFKLQQFPNHLKFLPLHYEVKSWQHAKIELFLTYFSFSLFSETKSPFLRWFIASFLHVALLIFLTYGIHMWRRPYKRFF